MGERALVRNGDDPEQVEKATETVAGRLLIEQHDLKNVLSTDSGRRVLYRLMVKLHCFKDCFDLNPAEMAHRASMQRAGFALQRECEALDPSIVGRMRTEALETLETKK